MKVWFDGAIHWTSGIAQRPVRGFAGVKFNPESNFISGDGGLTSDTNLRETGSVAHFFPVDCAFGQNVTPSNGLALFEEAGAPAD